MMEERIDPEQKNKDVYGIYFEVCVYSSTIRTKITTNAPGNIDSMFRKFKLNFDLLYMLTGDNKDIVSYDNDLILSIREWLEQSIPGVKDKKIPYIKQGMRYFEDYKKCLISYNIIKTE
jgi:hypothetical protein